MRPSLFFGIFIVIVFCSSSAVAQCSPPAALTYRSDVACYGGSTGVAGVYNISGGVMPYTFLWYPSGGTDSTATGLVAGTYTCVITDNIGCETRKEIILIQGPPLTANIYHSDVLCYGTSTGSAGVSASGALPITFTWKPSGSGPTIMNRPIGTYTCTIKDKNLCAVTRTVTISEPPVLSATTGQADVLCYGEATGIANITATGGTPSYSYLWVPSGGTNNVTSGIPAGSYSCTVTDMNGCLITKTVSISQSAPLTIVSSQVNVLCNGSATGEASLTVNGGVPLFTYLWSPGGETTASISNLMANSYSCAITDTSTNCVVIKKITISELPPVTATVNPSNACNGPTSGSADVAGTGGTAPYQYLWTPTGETATSVINLSIGNYSCAITDVNNCSSVTTFTIVESSPPVVTLSVANDTVCANSGMVTLTGTPPGGTYSGNGVNGDSFNTAIVVSGTYTLTYSYSNEFGCPGSAMTTIYVDECLGIENNTVGPKVLVYPNPFRETATIAIDPNWFHSKTRVDMELYDGMGRLVKREQITSPVSVIKKDNMSSGIYYYRLFSSTETGHFAHGVLILE